MKHAHTHTHTNEGKSHRWRDQWMAAGIHVTWHTCEFKREAIISHISLDDAVWVNQSEISGGNPTKWVIRSPWLIKHRWYGFDTNDLTLGFWTRLACQLRLLNTIKSFWADGKTRPASVQFPMCDYARWLWCFVFLFVFSHVTAMPWKENWLSCEKTKVKLSKFPSAFFKYI